MEESEFVIANLRHQVRDLQSLLNYLENRERVSVDEYSYVNAKLQEVIRRLREMERFSLQRGEQHGLRAHWLN